MKHAFVGCAALLMACGDGGVADDELGVVESRVDITKFTLPSLAIAERADLVRRYDRIDPTDLVPRGLLEDALLYFHVNQAEIPQTNYFVVVDLSLFSGKDRFWLVDVATGAVEPHKVAHGDGSDPDHDGYANSFGNVNNSHKSSLGFYLTGEIYDGNHPHSMRLDGLSRDGSPNGMANTNARSRLIVVHEADYVDDARTTKQGRSNGCLALDPEIEAGVVDKIHDGSLIYVAAEQLDEPVGRATCGDLSCDGSEDATSCADDCADPPFDMGDPVEDPATPPEAGGCSTGGGAGVLLAFAAVGVRRRRRR